MTLDLFVCFCLFASGKKFWNLDKILRKKDKIFRKVFSGIMSDLEHIAPLQEGFRLSYLRQTFGRIFMFMPSQSFTFLHHELIAQAR